MLLGIELYKFDVVFKSCMHHAYHNIVAYIMPTFVNVIGSIYAPDSTSSTD